MHYSANSSGLLAPLTPWLEDTAVSEILLNRPEEVYIEKNGQMQRVDVPEYSERRLYHLFQLIANENQQELSEKKPLLSGSLLDGSRIQLVLPPVALYPSFAIRRQVLRQLTLADYQARDYYRALTPCDVERQNYEALPEADKVLLSLFEQGDWPAFIETAIRARKNIIISGGTSSGKTTFLNACLRAIDAEDRLLLLEDTREIQTPHANQVSLLAAKGGQGLAQVSMQELVQCCLRMRPDRIIMGEIRGKEILDFVSACSTGHEGSLTTIHANNPRIAFMRMTQMYKQNNVPSMTDADILRELKEVIDVIIQVAKTPAGRQVQSVYYKYGHLATQGA